MIERMVVVLPTPLRPISETTWPGSTVKLMPNSTWLRPYDVWIDWTSSCGIVALA
jgi:hypothetical protein